MGRVAPYAGAVFGMGLWADRVSTDAFAVAIPDLELAGNMTQLLNSKHSD
jgi:hypothetical protein